MTIDSLRSLLTPPIQPVSSYDPNDILMGDVIHTDLKEYDTATHILVGCPQDIGVERNHGRLGAAKAPAAVRAMLHKLKPPRNAQSNVLDLGDIVFSTDLGIMHEALYRIVHQALSDKKIVMVIGGGNDCSLPDAKAVSSLYPDFHAINMDAHLDMRIHEQIHSGTPYRNLIEGGYLKASHLHEVGIQSWANSPRYLDLAQEMGVNIHTYHTIRNMGKTAFFNTLFNTIGTAPLFAGLDMDCVRAADAPGVSASSTIGFSANDIIEFARRCREHVHPPVFEITEVNPDFDIDGHTARLAAQTIYTFMYGTD